MKRLIITLAAAATAAGASAQQWGGLLMDKDLLMPTDMIELSQTQFNFGTARAMAMAGAFTSPPTGRTREIARPRAALIPPSQPSVPHRRGADSRSRWRP